MFPNRFTRRETLRLGLGAIGLPLSSVLGLQSNARDADKRTAAGGTGFGQAKSCIVLFAWGGMSHIDTYDPKPNAPEDYRGLFRPIATSVPGIQIGEHMPMLAKQTHRLAIVRSVNHRTSAHGKGMYWNLTGRPPQRPEVAENNEATGQDWPTLGSVVTRIKGAPTGMPGCAMLPYQMWDNNTRQGGHDAGWLGRAYDPIILKPAKGKAYGGISRDSGIADLHLPEGIDGARYEARRSLLHALQAPPEGPAVQFERNRDLANDLLLSPKVQTALKLEREDPKLRDHYGDHIGGQSVLLSRRLIEAGMPVVTVCMAAGDLNGASGEMWDTHSDNFNRLKNHLLPPYERAFSALLDDLDDRGLLEQTLVVSLTDFGRTPHVDKNAGRNHYPTCFSVVLAGGGIKGGVVHGKSDRLGAEPLDHPCAPADLHATILHALGIDPESMLQDPLGRPVPITDGGRVLPLFG